MGPSKELWVNDVVGGPDEGDTTSVSEEGSGTLLEFTIEVKTMTSCCFPSLFSVRGKRSLRGPFLLLTKGTSTLFL